MSIEWFTLMDVSRRRGRGHLLEDPLERPEWHGLGWLMPVLRQSAAPPSAAGPQNNRKPVLGATNVNADGRI